MVGNPRERRTAIVVCLIVATAAHAAAQQARPASVAVETSASIDETVDANGNYVTGVIVDGVLAVDLGHGFQGMVRPFVQRLANTGEWNRQIWIAAVRYERPGPVGIRVEAGLIPSPVGLANLTLRPHLNPTINQPSSLFTPLPLGLRTTRPFLIGAVYPYGAQVTLSGVHWDTRTAVIDTSPLRPRRVFAEVNPPRFPNVLVGAGVTPFVGFRVGASVTRGGWLRGGLAPDVTSDHDATVVAAESEFSFRYTKLSGEWVRDTMSTDTGDRVATGWFIQGQQTLAPRWFVAGRIERMSAPPLVLPIGTSEQHLRGIEETLGYRLTPEITLRVGHRARETFGRRAYDHQAAVSVVWWKRWL